MRLNNNRKAQYIPKIIHKQVQHLNIFCSKVFAYYIFVYYSLHTCVYVCKPEYYFLTTSEQQQQYFVKKLYCNVHKCVCIKYVNK